MKIMFIGDVFGKSGRNFLAKKFLELKSKYSPDFTIVNIENISHGKGISKKAYKIVKNLDIDVFTGGNHSFANKDVYDILEEDYRLLRPHNLSKYLPGKGYGIYKSKKNISVGVINLLGNVYISKLSCPFKMAKVILKKLKSECKVIILDFHAEATSEKRAMGFLLDGEISAVLGTHTHIQTADEEILPNSTAYITDVGMTGPMDSIIGVEKEIIIKKIFNKMPVKFEPAKKRNAICGVLINVDDKTGKANFIQRIFIKENEE